MPLIIPRELPAYQALERENVFVMPIHRAESQQIRPLRILIVNLMPTKIATELQLARLLANGPIQTQLTLLHTASHRPTHVPGEHLEAFYTTFEQVRHQRFDGMIITGAPVETMPFEDVTYWQELCQLMEYSKTHVHSTLHICWGAQAGLYYHYGIQKHPLPAKVSGVFSHRVKRLSSPLVRGFDNTFLAPHSRHTGLDEKQLAACGQLEVLAESEQAGSYLIASGDMRQVFVTGHPEYDWDTLDLEYRRDLQKGLNPAIPVGYYPHNDPRFTPQCAWRSHAFLLYHNWMNHCVYQTTPYDLNQLGQEE
ncbi:MAG: homoserine O-succinyltransferase [Candidatus Fournierella pullistercoris]|uniref:Homoserine O-acetyltransferase n=1 Tax=Candidatus Allofournierella pullistercoris TaxID=2838597 RepID=A0A948WT88_9FIRM|nr:homoserine O-succinyltransferase [Candidatus Fournierella pullistercoris]